MRFPLSTTDKVIDALFSDHFDFFEPNKSEWAPKMDVIEYDNNYILEMELPGVSKADVELSVKDNRLTISGTKKSQRKGQENAGKVHIVESFNGQFSRTIKFGEALDQTKIEALMDNGILIIKIPKPTQAQDYKIPIQ